MLGLTALWAAQLVRKRQLRSHRQAKAVWQSLVECSEPLQGLKERVRVALFPPRAGATCVAVVKGDVAGKEGVPTRVHSECLLGDILGSTRCECGQQLNAFMDQVVRDDGSPDALLLYLKGHEGMGIGLENKLRAYTLQDDEGLSLEEANIRVGFGADERRYGAARAALRSLEVKSVILYTTSTRKAAALGPFLKGQSQWQSARRCWGEPVVSPPLPSSYRRGFGTAAPSAGRSPASLCGSTRPQRRLSVSCQAQETEEERLRLDAEARATMEEHMKRIEELAAAGNSRALRTGWKWKIRKKVWNYLEDNDIADPPRPVHNRIPNFKGSNEAGQRVAQLPEFKAAKVVKVNPDTPQRSVRIAVMEQQKVLYVPQPRLRTGFFSRIMPGTVSPKDYRFASTPAGMKQFGQPVDLKDTTKIDLIVIGSTAVNPENGARVGKGEGFAELEYGILRLLKQIDENTLIVTSVHDSQVITEGLPPESATLMKHDVPVDIIVTPTRILRVDPQKRFPKPTGIYWDLLSPEKLEQVRVLRTMKQEIEKKTGTKLDVGTEEEALPPLAKRGKVNGPRRGR